MLRKIILAGVPEQVNIPIQICIERGIFAKHGIDVTYKLVPEGTGKMLQMIEQGEADVALTVTDAFIVASAQQRPVQLAGTWVRSPLVWAIAGGPSRTRPGLPQFSSFAELTAGIKQTSSVVDAASVSTSAMKLKFGISRLGSGSHTMAYYASMLHGLIHNSSSSRSTSDSITQQQQQQGSRDAASALDFCVANTFAGLREGVQSAEFDCFLWEVFTTKPWFDNGELKYLGEVATPWPAFSFVTGPVDNPGKPAASGRLSAETAAAIRNGLFPALKEAADTFVAEASNISGINNNNDMSSDAAAAVPAASVARIVLEHGHTEQDAQLWMSRCRYSGDAQMSVDRAVFAHSLQLLQQVGLVPSHCTVDTLWNNCSNSNSDDAAVAVNPIISFTSAAESK